MVLVSPLVLLLALASSSFTAGRPTDAVAVERSFNAERDVAVPDTLPVSGASKRSPLSSDVEGSDLVVRDSIIERLTNAERLARGLPLNPPKSFKKKRVGSQVRNIPDERTKTGTAKRAFTSCSPLSFSGYLQIVDRVDGSSYGYLAKSLNDFGGIAITADLSQALKVAPHTQTQTTTPFDLEGLNGPDAHYFFVGAGSFGTGDLEGGSSGHVYVVGTQQTQHGIYEGAPSSATGINAESEIWIFEDCTRLGLVYTNSDGFDSAPATLYYGYPSQSQGYIGATGDYGAFINDYPTAETHPIIDIVYVPI